MISFAERQTAVQIELLPKIESVLAQRAEQLGVLLERFIAEMIEAEAAEHMDYIPCIPTQEQLRAGEDLIAFREEGKLTLGGLKIKDMIHECHKHECPLYSTHVFLHIKSLISSLQSELRRPNMHIALEPSQEDFLKQAVSEGRYASESEAVNLAISLVQARDQKLDELRARVTASIKAGGSNTSEEMEAAMEAQLQDLHARGIPW